VKTLKDYCFSTAVLPDLAKEVPHVTEQEVANLARTLYARNNHSRWPYPHELCNAAIELYIERQAK
jgi:hypothetical protein